MPDPVIQDVSRSYEIYITLSVCTFAVTATTILRIAAKLSYRVPVGWDDYFMILGTCLNIVANAFDYKATASGFGRHTQFLTFDELVEAEKYAQLAVVVAGLALWATKVSICFFLLAIIKGTHTRFVWLIRIVMVLTTASQFVAALLWGLQAKPLSKLWDPRVHGTRNSAESFLAVLYIYYGGLLSVLGCSSWFPAYLTDTLSTAFVMVTDIFYALSPIYFLWNVQMSLRRKVPILALTGSGVLLIIVVALDIAFAREFLDTEDSTWALIKIFICDAIERNIGGFIANLPALWFLFRHLKKSSATPPPPHDNKNTGSNPSEDTRKSNVSSLVASGKHRRRDPYDLVADDCIPLKGIPSGKHSSLHTLGSGGLGSESTGDMKIFGQKSPGILRVQDDPTREEGDKEVVIDGRHSEHVRSNSIAML